MALDLHLPTLPMKKRTIAFVAILIGLLGVGVYVVQVGIMEFYSGRAPSFSIDEAGERGILVSLPTIESKEASTGRFRFRVKEAWIEAITRVEYKFFLLRREHIKGYRLMVSIDGTYEDASISHLICHPRVNGAINLNGYTGTAETPVFFVEIQPPLPRTLAITYSCDE